MLNFNSPMRTRVAPSPTGSAHIGLVRTAYVNYLAARSSGGKFILRIDDTDPVRSKPEFEKNILETLEWLGMEWDEIFWQSKRLDRYKQVAADLLLEDKAVTKDGAIFINIGDDYSDHWNDIIAGRVNVPEDKLDVIKNLVLFRSNGMPTYHFASCIDDIDMNINLVIRGTDHIENTHKHIQIYKLLGKEIPQFAHVGLIHFKGKKISKRDGVSNMETYKDRPPEAILNTVLKLGWSHPSPTIDKEHPIIPRETAIELFRQGHLKAAPSTLDLGKLDFFTKKFRNYNKQNAITG